jgi:hypothetical protein
MAAGAVAGPGRCAGWRRRRVARPATRPPARAMMPTTKPGRRCQDLHAALLSSPGSRAPQPTRARRQYTGGGGRERSPFCHRLISGPPLLPVGWAMVRPEQQGKIIAMTAAAPGRAGRPPARRPRPGPGRGALARQGSARARPAPYGRKTAVAVDRYLRVRARHKGAHLLWVWLGKRWPPVGSTLRPVRLDTSTPTLICNWVQRYAGVDPLCECGRLCLVDL